MSHWYVCLAHNQNSAHLQDNYQLQHISTAIRKLILCQLSTMEGRNGENCPLLMTFSIEFLQKLNIVYNFPFSQPPLLKMKKQKIGDQMTPQSHTASEWQGRTPTQVCPTSNPKSYPQKYPKLKQYLCTTEVCQESCISSLLKCLCRSPVYTE